MKRITAWITLILMATVLSACQTRDLGKTQRAVTGPDLIVVNANLDLAKVAPGLQVAASCDVKNSGSASAGASQLKYYLSQDQAYDSADRYLNYDNVASLAAGASGPESANLRIPAGTAFGNYYILFVADQKEVVNETNESNNTKALPIEVIDPNAPTSTGPDLVVEELALSAPKADPDEVVNVQCVVKNQGQATAGASRIKYYFSRDQVLDSDDTYRNYDKVDALSVDGQSAENANVRIPADTPDGVYYILVVADVDGVIPETVEDNNVAAIKIGVGNVSLPTDGPDLFPEQVTLSSDIWSPGEVLTATTVIKNRGGNAGEAKIRYYLSRDHVVDEFDIQLSYNKINEIGAGGSETKTAILTPHGSTNGGAWFLLFVVDADNQLAETNETNNIKIMPFTVALDNPGADGPDLMPVDVVADRQAVKPGGVVSITCNVKNLGNQTAAASRLKYFISPNQDYESSDQYINYDNVGELAPGASSPEGANLRIPLKTTYGTWYILLVADHTKEVAENIESNNTVAVKITVTDKLPDQGDDTGGGDKPDLIVTDVVLSTNSVRAGEKFDVTLAVKNTGVSAAPGSRVKYYLSRDKVYNTGDKYAGYDVVDALASGAKSAESVSPTVPADFGHGPWYLLLVADANKEVAESKEDNNTVAIPFTVLVDNPDAEKADLLVTGVTLDRAAYAPNSKVEIDFTVLNDGVLDAPKTRVKLYWSKLAIRDGKEEFLGYHRVPALAVGQSKSFHNSARVPHGTAEGDYYILLVADVNDEVEENFESNNTKAVNVTVSNDGKARGAYPFACPSYINNDVVVYNKGAIASFNALHLGYENKKDMAAMACIASHFRLIGLQEIETEQGVIDLVNLLETITGFDWSHHMSPHEVGDGNAVEFYAFIWRTDSVQFLGPVGFYPDPNDYVKREPYGANFKMGNFDFTFVVFHQRKGNALADTRAEAVHLIDIYDWFQAANGTENDLLIAGDFNLPGDDPAYTVVGHDGVTYVVDPEQKTSISQYGLINSYDNFFYPEWAFTELREHGVMDFTMGNHDSIRRTVSDHIPVWIVVDTTLDDD